MRKLAVYAAALGALALVACSGEKDEYADRPVDQIYNKAVDDLQNGLNKTAAKGFDEVERQHPYSAWATKSQLMSAYAYYQANDYDQAIIALERFIQLHPGSRDIGYAYYLKALCYYEQISDVKRDQSITQKAMEALDEVVKRFPDTRYARDARLKYDLTRDHLAGKEMEVGRFYQKRGMHVAAINRFRSVVEEYQTTTHVPEALHRLVECYTALGVVDEARKAAAVLGHNFPGSEWYLDSYQLATGEEPRDRTEQKGFLGRNFGWMAIF